MQRVPRRGSPIGAGGPGGGQGPSGSARALHRTPRTRETDLGGHDRVATSLRPPPPPWPQVHVVQLPWGGALGALTLPPALPAPCPSAKPTPSRFSAEPEIDHGNWRPRDS